MPKFKTLDIVPTPGGGEGETGTIKSSNNHYVETKTQGLIQKVTSYICSIRTIFPLISIGGMVLIALIVWSAGFGVSFVGIQHLGNELSNLSSQRAATDISFLFGQAKIVNENAQEYFTKFVRINKLEQKNATYEKEQFDKMYSYWISQFINVRSEYASLNLLLTNGKIYGVEITSTELTNTIFELSHTGDALVMITTNAETWERQSNFTVPGVTSYIIPTFEPAMKLNKTKSVFYGISSHVVFGTPVTSAARVIHNTQGEIIGTVNVLLRFDQLTGLLKTLNPVENGFMIFLDQDNRIGATSITEVSEIDFAKTCYQATENIRIQSFCQNLLNEEGQKIHNGAFRYFENGIEYYATPNDIVEEGQTYSIYTIIPSTHFTQSLLISTGITFGVTAIVIVLFILVTLILTLSFVNNLRILALSFRDIQRLDLDSSIVQRSEKIKSIFFEVSTLRDNFRRMKNALRAFTKFVPESVVQSFFHYGLKDSMEPQYATIFFLDIRNFTNIVETTEARVLIEEITEIFTGLTDCICKHDGVIVNYIGDAILAIFNAPLAVEEHEIKACQAAIECVKYLEDYKKYSCRIGISAGEANVGIYGSHTKKQFTCLGDIVNLASRLEGTNKFYKTDIMISERVKTAINNTFKTRTVDLLRVVGKKEPERVFNLITSSKWETEDADCYEGALKEFQQGNFIGALERIQKVKEKDDFVLVKTKQFEDYLDQKSPKNFDGVVVLNEK